MAFFTDRTVASAVVFLRDVDRLLFSRADATQRISPRHHFCPTNVDTAKLDANVSAESTARSKPRLAENAVNYTTQTAGRHFCQVTRAAVDGSVIVPTKGCVVHACLVMPPELEELLY